MATENYGSVDVLCHAWNIAEETATFYWNVFDRPWTHFVMFNHFDMTQLFVAWSMYLEKENKQLLLFDFPAMLEYPIGALKDSARPAYWVPDEDIEHCCVCQANFKPPKGEREKYVPLLG